MRANNQQTGSPRGCNSAHRQGRICASVHQSMPSKFLFHHDMACLAHARVPRYRSVAPKRAAKASAAPPRLSTMHVDEHSGARVRKARESMFAGSVNGDNDEDHEPPELEDGDDPFPAELLKQAALASGGSPPGRGAGQAKPAQRQVCLGCWDQSGSLWRRCCPAPLFVTSLRTACFVGLLADRLLLQREARHSN